MSAIPVLRNACSRGSLAAALGAALLLSACATTTDPAGLIPADAVPVTRTESNGDVVTQYVLAGKVRAVKVVPSRGPVYYLYDRNGDGIPDQAGDNPPQTWFKLFEWK